MKLSIQESRCCLYVNHLHHVIILMRSSWNHIDTEYWKYSGFKQAKLRLRVFQFSGSFFPFSITPYSSIKANYLSFIRLKRVYLELRAALGSSQATIASKEETIMDLQVRKITGVYKGFPLSYLSFFLFVGSNSVPIELLQINESRKTKLKFLLQMNLFP